ncbi:nucleoside recognition domain-containing protein [Oceanobacillus chungangensis]|uniref:DUF4190 domain-containing protein n=1 Tax=Oceanobacillus chungangensis TaxID=1229152 RepID=A0A3D8Q1Q9_9BACI|nr:nucleoside recognition domain-containing protein [Oceanobacillus chungangensis]RDW21787.1 hypothetical protein CWR45_02615 [Oceanobacillus chungangensis]
MDEKKYRNSLDKDDESRNNEYHFNDVETDSARNEEFASEITADDYRADRNDDTGDVISSYGWIGIALSVISFFMWPFVLGAAGIILGFVSRSKGADTLGNIAIAAGVISIIMTLFFRPFF